MRWNKRLAVGVICALICALISAAIGWGSVSAYQSSTPFVHKKKYVMGTVFEIVAYGESSARTSNAIDEAFQEIVRLDDVMSNYKSDSALSQLNHSTHIQPEPVPSDLYRVLEESLRYSRLSAGKFDVTVGPLVDLWKAAIRGGHAPASAEDERLRSCVGYQNLELLPPDRIKFRSSCVQIDLGGIGKGYALDRAVELLRSRGISHALLNAGGSTILAMGAPPGQTAWVVHLRDPSNKMDPQVMLSDNAVSTSEQTPPSLLSKEVAGHIIDPGNGMPLRTPFAVSIVAKSATASDALSTTLLLMGPEKGKKLVEQMPDVAAIWIASDGRSQVASSGPQILLSSGPRDLARRVTAEGDEAH